MKTVLSWLLLLGGIATVIVAASGLVPLVPTTQTVVVLGGLFATILGALGLLLGRVAGEVSRPLAPGTSNRVNTLSVSTANARGAVWPTRDQARGAVRPTRDQAPGATGGPRRSRNMAVAATSSIPVPTRAPRARRVSWAPLALGGLMLGVVWQATPTSGGSLLDTLVGVTYALSPFAAVLAVGSRLVRGRAWGPAVAVVIVALAIFAGAALAEIARSSF